MRLVGKKWTPFRYLIALIYANLMARWYNRQVEIIEDKGREWGITWILVAIGVVFTILPLLPLFGWRVFLSTFFLFVSSGSEMAWGSTKRTNEIYDLVEAVNDDLKEHTTKFMRLWSK